MTKQEYINNLHDSFEVIKQQEDLVTAAIASDSISIAEAIDINLKGIDLAFRIQKEIIKVEGFDDED